MLKTRRQNKHVKQNKYRSCMYITSHYQECNVFPYKYPTSNIFQYSDEITFLYHRPCILVQFSFLTGK